MRTHLRHLRSKNFLVIWLFLQSNGFWPLQSLSKNSEVHRDSNSQSGSSLGNVGVHSLTLSHTLGNMKCDSRPSHLAHTFASPCLRYKPKVRVVTQILLNIISLNLCTSKSKRPLSMQYILAYSCDKGRTIDNGFLICLHAYVVEGWIIISILIYIDQIVDMNSNNFI
jgi:hypothetical protein